MNYMNKKQLTISVIIVVVILAAVGGGVFWYLKSEQGVSIKVPGSEQQSEQPQVGDNQLQGEVVGSPAADVDTSDWQTYRNEEYGFEVRYPGGWVFEDSNNGISFGTIESKPGGYFWGINIYNSTKNIEGLIKGLGSQFNDRLEKREKITIGNKAGLLVTVTTDSHTDWILKSIFIENNDFIFAISNGAQDRSIFEIFLSSFKFLD